jgi:vacuolar-type H+-ATPase subunit D/Vma8
MKKANLEELKQELNDALEAIEILTNRLINLAVIENKFLSLSEKLRNQEIKCGSILFNIEAAEARVNDKVRDINHFFRFRFKWMERFIMKHRTYW